MPRPTRRRAFRAPFGARSSCCLMSRHSLSARLLRTRELLACPIGLNLRPVGLLDCSGLASCWLARGVRLRVLFVYFDQMRHAAQHAAHRLRIGLLDGLAGAPKAERLQRAARGDLLADRAAVLPDHEPRHGVTGSGSARFRLMSTPRISVIRCEERRPESAFIAAITTFTGFVLPSDFERMSLMPADSTTARTDPPAMTPVPFEAGRSSTFAAPKSAVMGCGMVRSTRGTRIRCFFASSMPFLIASGTSSAFPRPAPTCPRPSPTTTTAEKLKRRPPFTTFDTRLICTTRSVSSKRVGSILGNSLFLLELQPGLAGRV